jgi:hypothetical protein
MMLCSQHLLGMLLEMCASALLPVCAEDLRAWGFMQQLARLGCVNSTGQRCKHDDPARCWTGAGAAACTFVRMDLKLATTDV